MIQIIILFTYFTALIIIFSLVKFFFSKQNSIMRLNRYIKYEESKNEKNRGAHREYKKGMSILAKGIGNAKFLDGYKKTVQLKLARAHLLLRPEEYIAMCVIAFVLAGILLTITTGSVLMGFVGCIMGWILPSIFLKSKIKKRIKQFNDQLCDAIVLISNSLKAGYSFFQAVDTVSNEMPAPISQEFFIMQREMNLGVTTEKALENLVDRVKSDDLELVVTAVLIQRQVGGNLAEVLDNISSTIRERIKIKGEIKTITAQGRMSGLIISLLPPALAIILFLINREYISVLYKNPIGICILAGSVVMEFIGIYFINRIVKIEL